jgi:hypothetical protein
LVTRRGKPYVHLRSATAVTGGTRPAAEFER